MARTTCRMCGGDAGVFLEKGGYRILRCGSCSLVFLDRDTDAPMLREFYDAGYFESPADPRGYASYADCEGFLTANFRRRAERLRRLVPGGRVLDVGCGYGFFLRCLGPQYQGVGIDISEHAVRVARERYGVDASAGALAAAAFPPGHFSLVTMWDVIEHLPDPRAALRDARTVLRDDGVLALTTGDVESLAARLSRARWHLYTLPEHLWFFSERTLRRLLDETGFRVVELRREWCRYSLAYLGERLLKTLLPSRRPRPPLNLPAWVGRLTVPCNLFDVMYVACRKK